MVSRILTASPPYPSPKGEGSSYLQEREMGIAIPSPSGRAREGLWGRTRDSIYERAALFCSLNWQKTGQIQTIFSTNILFARIFANFRRFFIKTWLTTDYRDRRFLTHRHKALLNEKSLRPTPQKAFLILSSSVSDLIRNGRWQGQQSEMWASERLFDNMPSIFCDFHPVFFHFSQKFFSRLFLRDELLLSNGFTVWWSFT